MEEKLRGDEREKGKREKTILAKKVDSFLDTYSLMKCYRGILLVFMQMVEVALEDI